MAKKDFHSADATALLNTSTYSGPLTHAGTNPLTLFEKAVRDRVTDSYYWKEQCFGLNAASLCDRAVELDCVGGTYGDQGRPTAFLCLAFKLVTLAVEKNIVTEYLNWTEEGEDEMEDEHTTNGHTPERAHFKYLRALAAFYIRLMWSPVDIYNALSPLLADSRKLKRRTRHGYSLSYMDQFVDDLLTKDRVCGTTLWKLPPRAQLEDLDLLDPYVSPIQDEVDKLDEEEEEGERSEEEVNGKSRSGSPED